MEARYTINADQIVAEALEHEVMVVNLDTGFYYVLEGTGADLWPWLVAGASAPEMAAALAQRYQGEPAKLEQAVRDFTAQLASEGLLQPAAAGAPPAVTPAPEPRAAFSMPVMYKYTDMANLVQMDPIREFDESGWPRRQGTVKRA